MSDDISDTIYAYDMTTGERTSDSDIDTWDNPNSYGDNDKPGGIWSDGTTMWVSDGWDEMISIYATDSLRATACLEPCGPTAPPCE